MSVKEARSGGFAFESIDVSADKKAVKKWR